MKDFPYLLILHQESSYVVYVHANSIFKNCYARKQTPRATLLHTAGAGIPKALKKNIRLRNTAH